MGLCGPVVFVRLMDIQRPFPDVFAKAKNGFVAPEFCFIGVVGKKKGRLAKETRGAPKWFRAGPKRNRVLSSDCWGTNPACGAAPGGLAGFIAGLGRYRGQCDP